MAMPTEAMIKMDVAKMTTERMERTMNVMIWREKERKNGIIIII